MPSPLRRSLIALMSCSMLLAGAGAVPAGASAARHRRLQTLSEASPTQAPEGGAQAGAEQGQLPSAPPQPSAGAQGEDGTPGAPTPSVHTRRHGKCELTLEASSPKVVAGEAVTLNGTLACPEGTDAAGESISVSQTQRVDGAPATSALAPATVQPDGTFQLTTAPLTATSHFLASSSLAHRRARVVVRVTPEVTLEGPAAAGAQLMARISSSTSTHHATRARFTFTGVVDPTIAGTRVALQYGYATGGGRWRTVAYGRVDEQGRYTFVHGFGHAGQVSVRVVAHPRGELAAASEPLSYEVLGPHALRVAPALSSLSLSPPPSTVQAGVLVTFSGTLAPAAPAPVSTSPPAAQVVVLQRQNADGIGFHDVASTTTGDGAYAIPWTFQRPGEYVLRIRQPGGAGAAVSAPFTVTVTAAA